MRTVLTALTLACALLTTGCAHSAPTASPATKAASTTAAPANPNSQIVAAMPNSYQERPELPIDSCQDTFITTMKNLGYNLTQSVEPNTRFSYDYWHTSCIYRGEDGGISIGTTNSPNLAAQLTPGDGAFLEAYPISINERFAVISPSIDYERWCWIGMETSFGAISVSGGKGTQILPEGATPDACKEMTDFLHQLEPLLGD